MSNQRDSELIAALDELSAAIDTGAPGGVAALEQVAAIAGGLLPPEVRVAIRSGLTTGTWSWHVWWRAIRTRAGSWVVAVPPFGGASSASLLWTDPWPWGQRRLDAISADVPRLTRILFGYSSNAQPTWMAARIIRYASHQPLPTDALRRIRLSGWTAVRRPDWLLTRSHPTQADPLGDHAERGLEFAAYTCLVGEEGPLSPKRLPPRVAALPTRNRVAALVGILGSWLGRLRLGRLTASDAQCVLRLLAQGQALGGGEGAPALDVLRIWVGRARRSSHASPLSVACLTSAARQLLHAALPLLMQRARPTFEDFDQWFDEQREALVAGTGGSVEA